jgi:Lar family restriction alleviation protein
MKIHNYDTTLEELKNCPFCGSKPIAYLIGNEYTKTRKIVIKCPECRVQITNGAMRKSTEWLEEISIEQWNKRVNN